MLLIIRIESSRIKASTVHIAHNKILRIPWSF
jgi:hypothetical protein